MIPMSISISTMVVDNAASDADSHALAYKRGHSLKGTTDRALAGISAFRLNSRGSGAAQ